MFLYRLFRKRRKRSNGKSILWEKIKHMQWNVEESKEDIKQLHKKVYVLHGMVTALAKSLGYEQGEKYTFVKRKNK
jgi:hypothetical protein